MRELAAVESHHALRVSGLNRSARDTEALYMQ
jgi:hypothetical protein